MQVLRKQKNSTPFINNLLKILSAHWEMNQKKESKKVEIMV